MELKCLNFSDMHRHAAVSDGVLDPGAWRIMDVFLS
jgi:hypothetical protein